MELYFQGWCSLPNPVRPKGLLYRDGPAKALQGTWINFLKDDFKLIGAESMNFSALELEVIAHRDRQCGCSKVVLESFMLTI